MSCGHRSKYVVGDESVNVTMSRASPAWAALIVLALAACGSGQPSAAAPPSASVPAATAGTAPPSAAPSVAPSAALPNVPDFRVVAYQGDEAFGGHDGHFSAAFAAGRPVVLLYFAGL
jgi:hypothetical protein